MAKEKEKTASPKKEKAKGLSMKVRLLLVALSVLSIVFLPTSMLLFFGMLPSIVATLISFRGRGARASTVTAMNLAGCIPFVFKLWSSENNFEGSVDILTSPNALMIMYTAAAFGYMIDWVVTGLVSSFLYQKGITRMKAIKKQQEKLIENWGEEVSGQKKKAE